MIIWKSNQRVTDRDEQLLMIGILPAHSSETLFLLVQPGTVNVQLEIRGDVFRQIRQLMWIPTPTPPHAPFGAKYTHQAYSGLSKRYRIAGNVKKVKGGPTKHNRCLDHSHLVFFYSTCMNLRDNIFRKSLNYHGNLQYRLTWKIVLDRDTLEFNLF